MPGLLVATERSDVNLLATCSWVRKRHRCAAATGS